MINFFFTILIFSSSLFAQDFSGCGEYSFKGVLRYDDNAPLKMSYVVHEGTKSQMLFHLIEKEDVSKLALLLDSPSSFKAKILHLMDTTQGSLQSPFEIARRYPNPLGITDTEIKKLKKLKCD